MTMRHFVSGGKFIVALNLQRLDQPQRLLVLTNPRVRIQGSRTFEAMSSQHNVVVTRHGRRPCGGGLPDDFSDHSDGHDSQSMR